MSGRAKPGFKVLWLQLPVAAVQDLETLCNTYDIDRDGMLTWLIHHHYAKTVKFQETGELPKPEHRIRATLVKIKDKPFKLNGKQKQILDSLVRGIALKDVAKHTGINLHNVNRYMREMRERLGLESTIQVVLWYVQEYKEDKVVKS